MPGTVSTDRLIGALTRFLAIALFGLASVSPPAAAHAAEAQSPIGPLGPPGAPASAFPKPARPVAPIVSGDWADEPSRDENGEADRVMRYLGIRPGMTVADIGAGGGYYTVRLARRVGSTGRVIAEDVMPAYLEALRQRVEREQLVNVVFGLGEPHDPRLPPKSVDLVLIVHAYHEIEQPYGLLTNLLPALRDNARVAILDIDRPTQQHGTPRSLLLCEVKAVGFRQTRFTWLRDKFDYLSVLEPPKQAPSPDGIKPCSR